MNIRRRMYAIYKGEECLFYEDENGRDVISTRNKELTDNTFEKKVYPDGYFCYRKEVTPEDIGEVYEVQPYAIYEGEEFWIFGCDGIVFCLVPKTKEQIEKYDTYLIGREEYLFDVPMEDVVVFEKVKYFDKYKYFAGEGFQYYREERVIVENPEW